MAGVRRTTGLAAGAIAALVLGCRSTETNAQAPPVDAAAIDVSAEQDADVAAPLPYGSTCTAATTHTRGSCPEPLICALTKATSGFCIGACPCATGGVCFRSPQVGELCVAPCATRDDCAAGLICDPTWKGCVPSGTRVAPRLATCAEPALAKRAWGKATQLTNVATPGDYQLEPTAALDAAGNLIVAFNTVALAGRGAPSQATTIVRADGTADAAALFAGARARNIDPWMTATPDGRIHYVWFGFDGDGAPERNSQIGYATTRDGKTWSTIRSVHDEVDCPTGALGCLDKPMIASAPDGTLYVFYAGGGTGMKMVKSTDGGATFGPSVAVGPGFYGDARVTAKHVIHAVMVRGGGDWMGATSNAVIYVRSGDDGATFAEPIVVSRSGEPVPQYFSNAQVVADESRGLLYVVYPAGGRDGVWDIVLATSRDDGKTWSHRKVNDDARCANHATPHAALDPVDGRLHVTWIENRSGAGGVGYAVCESGGASCGANEAVNDAPFAAYELVRWSPRWMGEYGVLLLDATRRTLHAMWAQPVADDRGGSARVFHATRRL